MTILVDLYFPSVLKAQTEWKDRPTCIAVNDQLNPSVAQPTASDYTVTVWEDERHAGTSGSDIYIQQIDNQHGLPQWIGQLALAPFGRYDVVTERFDGIPVCTAVGDQRNPRAAYDGMVGVIVVWEDYRNDPTMAVAEIYAQRIDLVTGRPDPAWPVDGVPICQTGYHAERPRVAGTVDGAYITWIDYRNDPGYVPRDRDIYLQYINSTTATWPPAPTNWTANGIPVAMNQSPDQINPELAVDNIFTLDLLGNLTQGVVVTYQDDRYLGATFGTPVWSVFANRIDANGSQCYTTGNVPFTGDVAAGPSYEHQEYPRIVTTGANPGIPIPSAILVWQDAIDDPFSGATDIYSQRLDQIGTRLFAGPNGMAVCQAPSFQKYPQPDLWEDPTTLTPFVTVGWEDNRNGANNTDIYAALIDALPPGAVVNPQGINGEPICTMTNNQMELSLDNVLGSGPTEYTAFVWTHETSAGKDIHCQKVQLPAWIETYPPNGTIVTEAKSDQVLPQANREVFIWQDGRRDPIPHDNQDDENIYCQTPGMCTGYTDMKWRDMFAKWTYGEDAANFRFVADPEDGSTYVVWDEMRYPFGPSGNPARIVFIQKIDKDGVPRWSNNGVAVSPYFGNGTEVTQHASRPDVCIDGAGGARVIWQYTIRTTGREKVWWAHVDNTSNVVPSGIGAWGDSDNEFFIPRITAVNDLTYHAVIAACWLDHRTGTRAVQVGGLWTSNNGVTPIQMIPQQQGENHWNLHLMYDGQRFAYTLTNERTFRDVTIAGYDLSGGFYPQPPNPGQIAYAAWYGHDLNLDDNRNAQGLTSALFTYAIQPSPFQPVDVFLGNFWVSTLYATHKVTNNTTGVNMSTHPAITSDSIVHPSTSRMGALLAWNTVFTDPVTGLTSHRVESNRVQFTSIPPLTATNVFASHFLLASGLPDTSYPDIARIINTMPVNGIQAAVVWEGGGETSQCQPPRPIEIYGQHVDYDPQAANPGPQWAQPSMIGPGAGNYFQTDPIVKASLPGSVNVFWNDTQSGNTGVMGTRLPIAGSTIKWAKRNTQQSDEHVPAAIAIGDVWPQPAAAATEIGINIKAPVNDMVTVALYDLLGRHTATLFEGIMQSPEATLHFSPGWLNLPAGSYMLRMTVNDIQTSRVILITR